MIFIHLSVCRAIAVSLFIFLSVPSFAANITPQKNLETGLLSWVAESEGFSIELLQLMPDFVRAIYLSHDYPREEVEKIAAYCVFGSVIKNTSQQTLEYNIADWSYIDASGKSLPIKTKSQWLEQWQKAGIKFSWTLLPDNGTFYVGDWQQGFTTIKLPRDSEFSIHYTWTLDGVEQSDIFEGLRCAPDSITEK